MTPFLVVGVVGLVLLLVSLVVGDFFEGVLGPLDSDVFSSAVLGGFVSAFGFGGAIAQAVGAPLPVTVVVGIVAGAGFGWFAAWLTRVLKTGQDGDSPVTADALGRDATVLTDIPADGFGVVRVQYGGHQVRLNARAEAAIGIGVEVHVTQVLSPTAVVVAPTRPELVIPDAAPEPGPEAS